MILTLYITYQRKLRGKIEVWGGREDWKGDTIFKDGGKTIYTFVPDLNSFGSVLEPGFLLTLDVDPGLDTDQTRFFSNQAVTKRCRLCGLTIG
jgi:hypothetical protein